MMQLTKNIPKKCLKIQLFILISEPVELELPTAGGGDGVDGPPVHRHHPAPRHLAAQRVLRPPHPGPTHHPHTPPRHSSRSVYTHHPDPHSADLDPTLGLYHHQEGE